MVVRKTFVAQMHKWNASPGASCGFQSAAKTLRQLSLRPHPTPLSAQACPFNSSICIDCLAF